MALQALLANNITLKLLYLLRDARLTPASDPLRTLPAQRKVWLFVAIQLAGFGATFAVTQTVAAIGFPVVILALIPLRALVLPLWFSEGELAVLDAPTASAFTMVSVGGQSGGMVEGEGEGEGDVVRDREEQEAVVSDVVLRQSEMAERGEGGLTRKTVEPDMRLHGDGQGVRERGRGGSGVDTREWPRRRGIQRSTAGGGGRDLPAGS